MKTSAIYWLRWIAVLPGGLIIGILSTFPLHWILQIVFSSGEEISLGSVRFFANLFARQELSANDIEYLLYPLVIAATFVFVGYKIAPNHKIKIAIILFVVYAIAWSVSTIAVISGVIKGTEFSSRTILALIGAAIGLYAARQDENQNHKLLN